MENYEEKYKAALKRAQTILKLTDNPKEANGYVFTIFPELCEREDERIRKEIIAYLKDIDFDIEESWIPWLEKQGEKKPISSTEETELNSLAFLSELGYTCIPPKEEQNAWSEEDERMLGKCIDAASGYYSLEDKQNIKDWLRAIKDRIQPQPKQDWSEEDEKMRSSTIFFLNEFKEVYKDGAQKCITWLKSLKPQPRWKPTEEQLHALFEAHKQMSADYHMPLITLYNDLKSL